MNRVLRDLIIELEDEINNNDWEEVYTYVSNTNSTLVGEFTWTMMSAGLDLMSYIKRQKWIPYRFFANTPLKSFIIPEGVTDIGNEAFAYCDNLNSVTIPSSIEDIGSWVFSFCLNLTSIIYNGTKDQWESIKKDSKWNYSSSIKKIICIDGDIELRMEGGN